MQNRVDYIDGIRGVSALAVVLFHFFYEALGVKIPWLRNPLTDCLINGQMDVIIFFILSGDSLCIHFFRTENQTLLLQSSSRRYFRLTFLIILTSFVVYLILKNNLELFDVAIHHILARPDWMPSSPVFLPNIFDILAYSLSGVYLGGPAYIPFFWTMKFELLGSFFIFLYCFSYKELKSPILALLLLYFIFLLANSYVCLFFIGALFCYIREKNILKTSHFYNLNTFFKLTLIATMMISFVWCQHHLNGLLKQKMLFILAPIVVLTMYSTQGLRKLFSSKLCLFLGKISYPLYAIHFAILISFFSYGIFFSAQGRHISTLTKIPSALQWEWLGVAAAAVLISIWFAYLLMLLESWYLKKLKAFFKKHVFR